MKFANFCGGTYSDWSGNAANERAINLYPSAIETPSGKSRAALYGTPGTAVFGTLPTGPIRALWAGEGRLFAVGGSKFYEVDSSGTPINGLGGNPDRGDVGDDANHTPVDIAPNGTQLLIVSAGKVFIDTGTEVVQPNYGLGYGTVDTRATSYVVERVSGDPFLTNFAGGPIMIAGVTYTIDYVANADSLRLVTAIPDTVDAQYAVPLLSGVVNTVSSGHAVTQMIGETFNPSMVGGPIIIGNDVFTVESFIDIYNITTVEDPGTHTGLQYAVPRAYGTVNATTHYNQVYRVYGDPFLDSWENGPIVIDGTTYTVWRFLDGDQLIVTEPIADMDAKAYTIPTGDSGELLPVLAGTRGCFLDSYFIVAQENSKAFAFSKPWDGKQWDPLEQSVKESYPDDIAAVFADHEELWVFGTHYSTEVWRNEGVAEAAGGFVRDPGAMIHIGCVAPWSIVNVSQGLYFLGGDIRGRVVAYRAQGFQPVRVSTHAIEQIWNTYTNVYDAYAYSYEESGHEFWVISFQTADATWVYDATSQQWHERQHYDGHRHKSRCHAFVWGKHYVGAWDSGIIYQMSQNLFSDAGTPIRRVRQAPHLSDEEVNVFHHRLQIDIEVTAIAPNVTLDWSDDDGVTFNTPRTRAPSVLGNRGRLIFNRLGHARDRVYRVTTSDAVKIAIVDAYLNPPPTVGVS